MADRPGSEPIRPPGASRVHDPSPSPSASRSLPPSWVCWRSWPAAPRRPPRRRRARCSPSRLRGGMCVERTVRHDGDPRARRPGPRRDEASERPRRRARGAARDARDARSPRPTSRRSRAGRSPASARPRSTVRRSSWSSTRPPGSSTSPPARSTSTGAIRCSWRCPRRSARSSPCRRPDVRHAGRRTSRRTAARPDEGGREDHDRRPGSRSTTAPIRTNAITPTRRPSMIACQGVGGGNAHARSPASPSSGGAHQDGDRRARRRSAIVATVRPIARATASCRSAATTPGLICQARNVVAGSPTMPSTQPFGRDQPADGGDHDADGDRHGRPDARGTSAGRRRPSAVEPVAPSRRRLTGWCSIGRPDRTGSSSSVSSVLL